MRPAHSLTQPSDAGRIVDYRGIDKRPTPYAVAPTSKWIGRMAVVESICSDHLAGRFAKAIAGEAAYPVGDPSRIPHALAQWEIQAHRTLATHPVPANIVLVARTQGLPTARVVRRLGRQTLGPNP